MELYPYLSPYILTDTIFVNYGGHTGTSVAAQRNAAYFIAEKMASEDMHTFLQLTTITGTYPRNWQGKYQFNYNFIWNINQVRFLDNEGNSLLTVVGNDYKNYFDFMDDERGLICVIYPGSTVYTQKIEFVYQCGIPSGTAYSPDILLGLTTYADLVLNEILGYGNEAPGDVGVQSYRNIGYSEARIALMRTNFGSSARAQFAYKQFLNYKKRKWVGM